MYHQQLRQLVLELGAAINVLHGFGQRERQLQRLIVAGGHATAQLGINVSPYPRSVCRQCRQPDGAGGLLPGVCLGGGLALGLLSLLTELLRTVADFRHRALPGGGPLRMLHRQPGPEAPTDATFGL